MRQFFGAYRKKWLKNCDFTFDDEFLRETNQLLETLTKRVEREEQFLFAKLEAQAEKERASG